MDIGVVIGGFIVLVCLFGYDAMRMRRDARLDLVVQGQLFERVLLSYQLMAQDAMALVKASSLAEHAQIQVVKEQSNVQLHYLQDTLAKQGEIEAARAAKPKTITTEDGKVLNMSDVELLG